LSPKQATGKAHPDDKQIGFFLCHNADFGQASAVRRLLGAFRHGATSSKAEKFEDAWMAAEAHSAHLVQSFLQAASIFA